MALPPALPSTPGLVVEADSYGRRFELGEYDLISGGEITITNELQWTRASLYST
ncbi:MAG: hypothetical protein HRU01_24075 [Myxococcales bacterium]|nr:hypothetical protein [Myxococcales bacterium]